MTQPNFSPRFKQRLLMVAALILLVAIAAVLIISSTVRQQYDTLLATTIKPTLSPPVSAFRPLNPFFRMGSIGPEVIQLQQRLKALGYYQGELDGQYGKGTQEAISRFQNQNSLEADGMAGALTLSVLYGDQAKPAQAVTQTPAGEPVYQQPGN